jgi:hypothetical protein
MFRFTILLRKRRNQVSEIGDVLLDAANFTDRRGKLSLTISARPVGVGAASQQLMPTDERFGLLTRIAATEDVSLCALMKSSARLLNLKRRLELGSHRLHRLVRSSVLLRHESAL